MFAGGSTICKIIAVAAAVCLTTACVTRTPGVSTGRADTTITNGTSPAPTHYGQPVQMVLDAATAAGMDCAQVDQRPYAVWECHQTVGVLLLSVELISADEPHLALMTVLASNTLDNNDKQDPAPPLRDIATKVVPASYTGPETADILSWVNGNGGSSDRRFGPLRTSLMGDTTSFLNFTVLFEEIDVPLHAEVFDEFHVEDAFAWGEATGLRCTQGVLNPDVGGFEKVRCTATSGPRAAVDFELPLDSDTPDATDFSDTDIAYISGNFEGDNPASKEALAELIAKLVFRLAGNSADADRARAWVIEHGGVRDPSQGRSRIGTLNATLSVTLDDWPEYMYASVKLYPAGYPEQ